NTFFCIFSKFSERFPGQSGEEEEKHILAMKNQFSLKTKIQLHCPLRRFHITAVVALAASIGALQMAADEPLVFYGPSDAKTIAVESGFHYNMNFFWWDPPDLTGAVRAAPNVGPAKLQAVHDAIAVWSTILSIYIQEISLTEVTDTPH